MLNRVLAHKFMVVVALLVGLAYYVHSKNVVHAVVVGAVAALVLKLVDVDRRMNHLLKRV